MMQKLSLTRAEATALYKLAAEGHGVEWDNQMDPACDNMNVHTFKAAQRALCKLERLSEVEYRFAPWRESEPLG
jgi:hypothetical protein